MSCETFTCYRSIRTAARVTCCRHIRAYSRVTCCRHIRSLARGQLTGGAVLLQPPLRVGTKLLLSTKPPPPTWKRNSFPTNVHTYPPHYLVLTAGSLLLATCYWLLAVYNPLLTIHV